MVPLKALVLVFGALFAAGVLLTLPLYQFNLKKFANSAVFIKIIFWLPIFAIFIGLLYANSWLRLAFLTLILVFCLIEIAVAAKPTRPKYYFYYLGLAAGLSHLALLNIIRSAGFNNILITLALATVLGDVAAFFAGNYLGRHNLPAGLNPKKSWEGVAGEAAGAFLGIVMVNIFIQPVISLWLFVPIGLGCAIGDLANSYFKRQAGISDWSRAIPGHGGFTDRLSSLSGSAALTFYFLLITGWR